MLLTVLMFAVAICLSTVAAYYSIVGLTAIFAAAVMPIILMGSILEVAKLTVTVWLHEYWHRARWLMKIYLCVSVIVLMIITSMGIFGFLSKAHSDQGMVSGDVLAKIAIYDEKIKTAKENIDANRKALKQLDESVDQVLGRSTDEKGADKAVALRRSQGKERARLLTEIETEQKKISSLNEERSPIAAEVRKVEAEVGPIKYIASLIYGDNPDANLLERAVRWVIIMLVIVFDPLAVMMLLAATESRKWLREDQEKPKYDQDDGPLTTEQIDQIKEIADKPNWRIHADPSPPGWMYNTTTTTYPSTEQEVEEVIQEFDRTKHAYLDKPFVHFENLKPMVHAPSDESHVVSHIDNDDEEELNHDNQLVKQAMILWKQDNSDATLKEQRRLFSRGLIDQLPWEKYLNDPRITLTKFGKELPALEDCVKGELFIITRTQPTELYKFNGDRWIVIDKSTTDQYTHNQGYIEFLISAIDKGEYDTELLTESEKAEIQTYLQRNT